MIPVFTSKYGHSSSWNGSPAFCSGFLQLLFFWCRILLRLCVCLLLFLLFLFGDIIKQPTLFETRNGMFNAKAAQSHDLFRHVWSANATPLTWIPVPNPNSFPAVGAEGSTFLILRWLQVAKCHCPGIICRQILLIFSMKEKWKFLFSLMKCPLCGEMQQRLWGEQISSIRWMNSTSSPASSSNKPLLVEKRPPDLPNAENSSSSGGGAPNISSSAEKEKITTDTTIIFGFSGVSKIQSCTLSFWRRVAF